MQPQKFHKDKQLLKEAFDRNERRVQSRLDDIYEEEMWQFRIKYNLTERQFETLEGMYGERDRN